MAALGGSSSFSSPSHEGDIDFLDLLFTCAEELKELKGVRFPPQGEQPPYWELFGFYDDILGELPGLVARE